MIFLIVENLLFIHQCWAYFANGFSNNIGILEVFRNVVKDLTLDKRVGYSHFIPKNTTFKPWNGHGEKALFFNVF